MTCICYFYNRFVPSLSFSKLVICAMNSPNRKLEQNQKVFNHLAPPNVYIVNSSVFDKWLEFGRFAVVVIYSLHLKTIDWTVLHELLKTFEIFTMSCQIRLQHRCICTETRLRTDGLICHSWILDPSEITKELLKAVGCKESWEKRKVKSLHEPLLQLSSI